MKNNLYALRRTMLLVCLTLLCLPTSIYAQQPDYYYPKYNLTSPMPAGTELDTTFHNRMRHIFGLLETNRVPKGILLDYAMEFTNMSNYNGNALTDTNFVDQAAYWDIYRTLYTARIHTSAATLDLNNLDSEWYNNRQPGRITLAGMYFQYARFRNDAVSANKLTISNEKLVDKYVSGAWQNPYQVESVFAMAPATKVYEGLTQQLLLPTALWESNEIGSVSSLEVDAGDGMGFRIMSAGQALSVVYPDTGRKELKYRLNLINGTSLISHSEIDIRSADDDLLTLLSGDNPCHLCQVTATEPYLGQYAQGYIRIKYANPDNKLRNPLIVVEGFDPYHILEPESKFGDDLMVNFEANLNNSVNLRSLVNSSYDVIYVDWKNGTDDIRRNAMLVKEIIRLVNSKKVALANGLKADNVIIGISMGGLAVRWALKDMEDKNEIHDTRLFVSFDTPHQGATVPIGYQHLARHVKGLYLRTGLTASTAEAIQFFRGGDESAQSPQPCRQTSS
ncbi:esterase/lipase family protein [Pontibacter burrus]|uniref:DUF676 domain-containing protein n=1 Tax=Pontibacter burrus TaxID=2704466 RepID=A0A6B3LKG0_9BACT|nr:hypothetical protein [Pontibacter burrus]NEM97412.1 hypothetical protein [Pontibacter burrus]